MQLKHIVIAALILTAAILACSNPLTGTPAGPINVETIVAGTLQALTESAPSVTPLPPTPSLLSRPLYFLNNDSAGLAQVYRLEKDGKTIKQLTFEPANVTGYDVSPIDGGVAYVSNNQLLNVNADGSSRSMLVDGGAVDTNSPYLNSLSNPVWSPNGGTIAFAHKGLNFYSIISGQSNLVLADLIQTTNDYSFPTELYRPEKYSADGSKLIITLAFMEGASTAIYYPNGNALVRLKNDEGAMICCGSAKWTADGSAFYAGNASLGMYGPGLWRVDAASGDVTTLIPGDAGNGTFNFAYEPYLAPDNQLYFFFTNQSPDPQGMVNRAPLQMVRSGYDGLTGRTVLRPEIFNLMNEALWAPDASFVIVANAAIADIYQGGAAQLYYTDAQKAMLPLLPFAMEMKWGP
jgi:hypothetical protein